MIVTSPSAEAAVPPAEEVPAVDAASRSGKVAADGAADEGTDLVLRTPDGVERMRFFANGNSAMGYNTNQAKLGVFEYGDNTKAISGYHSSTIEADTNQTDYGLIQYMLANPAAGVTNSGSAIASYIAAYNNSSGTVANTFGGRIFSGVYAGQTGTVTNAYGLHVAVQAGGGSVTNGYGLYLADVAGTNDYSIYQASSNDINYFAGKTAIGTSSLAGALNVATDGDSAYALNMAATPYVEANTNQNDTGSYMFAGEVVSSGVTNSGTLTATRTRGVLQGPGTLANTTGILVEAGVQAGATGTVNTAYGALINLMAGSGTVTTGFATYLSDVPATNGWGVYQAGANDLNLFNGSVGVGAAPTAAEKLRVAGNLAVTGNIVANGSITGATVLNAVYQDLAEWVPASTDMEPGTVVVLNHDRDNEVMPSHSAYDTSVAGVVSAQPGILLGVGSASKEQIATTGRVRVRVDATRGAIRIGDLLVTSDVPGTAMKSAPIDLGGVPIHRPGTIIGKALESLESGTGEILVLLSLQ